MFDNFDSEINEAKRHLQLLLLLLLLHQFSLRAHFQVSININKYIIESEARTVRRLTKSDIEKVCLESLPENVI